MLVELLFCLLERLYSQLKLIKPDRRSSLGEDRLDQLLQITVDAPPLSKWVLLHVVMVGGYDSQNTNKRNSNRKVSKIRAKSGQSTSTGLSTSDNPSTSTEDDDTNTDYLTLDDWEAWLT